MFSYDFYYKVYDRYFLKKKMAFLNWLEVKSYS